MGAPALRGAGRDVNVRQQTGGGELPRSVVSASGTIEMSRMEDRSSPASLLDIPEEARSPAINDLLFNLNQEWQLPFRLMLSLTP